MITTAAILLIVNVLIKTIVAFSTLILAHEFGHFIVAKKSGVWVEEFGFGLPPRLGAKKIGETIYSINLLPIGGFVRLHGETQDGKPSYPKYAFINKSKKKRVAISLAGILANFVLAVCLFAILYSFQGLAKDERVKIVEVVSNSPAAEAGFEKEDQIFAVNDNEVLNVASFQEITALKKGQELQVFIKRQEEGGLKQKTLLVTPRVDHPADQGPLGVVVAPLRTYVYYPPLWQRPFIGVYYGFKDALFLSQAIVVGLFGLAGEVSQAQIPEEVVGPFGILALFAYVAKLGLLPLINFTGVFSVNLAILNLVPFPPLDGSRVLFIGVERALGKKILPKIESGAHIAGMIVLIALMLALTGREIPKLLKAGSISSFAESILPIE